MYSCGPLHTDEQGLVDLLEPIYNISVLMQPGRPAGSDGTIETSGERESGKYVLVTRNDDDIPIYFSKKRCRKYKSGDKYL